MNKQPSPRQIAREICRELQDACDIYHVALIECISSAIAAERGAQRDGLEEAVEMFCRNPDAYPTIVAVGIIRTLKDQRPDK